jgi:hypothetical protein
MSVVTQLATCAGVGPHRLKPASHPCIPAARLHAAVDLDRPAGRMPADSSCFMHAAMDPGRTPAGPGHQLRDAMDPARRQHDRPRNRARTPLMFEEGSHRLTVDLLGGENVDARLRGSGRCARLRVRRGARCRPASAARGVVRGWREDAVACLGACSRPGLAAARGAGLRGGGGGDKKLGFEFYADLIHPIVDQRTENRGPN